MIAMAFFGSQWYSSKFTSTGLSISGAYICCQGGAKHVKTPWRQSFVW